MDLADCSWYFCVFPAYLFWVYGIREVWVVYPPLILCDILGLGVALGFVELRTKNADNEKLRQLLELEKKQFEMTRSNVEFVNRNAHDLKHYIHKIQRMEAPEAEELEAVLTKVEAYESAFQTGNATLDIILTEKKSALSAGGNLLFLHGRWCGTGVYERTRSGIFIWKQPG